MKKQYTDAANRVLALAQAWEPRFDLPGIAVEHRFHETMLDPENGDTTAAVTKAVWQYRFAIIHWYLPNIAGMSDDDLENTVVHEYVHVLLGPLANHIKASGNDLNELATENVARALLATRKGSP
jgi:hypothetical protein